MDRVAPSSPLGPRRSARTFLAFAAFAGLVSVAAAACYDFTFTPDSPIAPEAGDRASDLDAAPPAGDAANEVEVGVPTPPNTGACRTLACDPTTHAGCRADEFCFVLAYRDYQKPVGDSGVYEMGYTKAQCLPRSMERRDGGRPCDVETPCNDNLFCYNIAGVQYCARLCDKTTPTPTSPNRIDDHPDCRLPPYSSTCNFTAQTCFGWCG